VNADQSTLHGNIWKLYLLSAIATFGFSIPIFIPFQQEHGLTLQQAFLLQAAYSIVLVIFEVPSGYLADRWGRRNVISLGSFALFLGMLTYAVTSGFSGFLLAEILLAMGLSFHSGTLEALTYDTLIELNEEKRYVRVNGLQGFLALGSKAGTSLLVGSLAAMSLRLPFWADVSLFGTATFVSFFLVEPRRHMLEGTQHLAAMWKICKTVLFHNRTLRAITLLYMVVAAIDVQIFWFLQPYQMSIGFPMTLFGVTNAVMCILGALAYKEAHRLGKRAERTRTLFGISAGIMLTCLILGTISATWGLLFFILEGMLFGLFDPLLSNLANRLTTSDVRATVLSIRSLASRLLFAALTPILGYLADVFSLSFAFLATGVIGIVTLTLTFLITRTAHQRV
jgi:MFS family permease